MLINSHAYFILLIITIPPWEVGILNPILQKRKQRVKRDPVSHHDLNPPLWVQPHLGKPLGVFRAPQKQGGDSQASITPPKLGTEACNWPACGPAGVNHSHQGPLPLASAPPSVAGGSCALGGHTGSGARALDATSYCWPCDLSPTFPASGKWVVRGK